MDVKKILERQLLPFIKMIEKVLDYIDDVFLLKMINNKYQCWKLIYHPLFWMDYHLSDKINFNAPPFHIEDLNKLDIISNRTINKAELIDYTKKVKERLLYFIKKMSLNQNEKQETDLDNLLAQLRHASFHIGMLYTVIFYEKNYMPETLSPEINKAGGSSYNRA